MIIGIGTDIFLMSRISDGSIQEGDAFWKRAYTVKEHQEAEKRIDKQVFYATRFCAKEAVYKAISVANIEFRPGEIEIFTDDMGKPHVFLLGRTKDAVDTMFGKYMIHVSISYDTAYASSFAIAEKCK